MPADRRQAQGDGGTYAPEPRMCAQYPPGEPESIYNQRMTSAAVKRSLCVLCLCSVDQQQSNEWRRGTSGGGKRR